MSENSLKSAAASGRALQKLVDESRDDLPNKIVRLSVEQQNGARADFQLPEASLSLIGEMLEALGDGKQVTVHSSEAELSTQEAANLLRVSRPYLVKLLNERRIPYRKVGPRRRILLKDILRFKEHDDETRNVGLDELAAESQKLGLYIDVHRSP